MNLKSTTIFTSFILITISMHAQNYCVGLKGGTSFTSVNGNDFQGTTYRNGLSTGLTFDYEFKNNISIGSYLTYNQKGFGKYLYILNNHKSNLTYFYSDYLSFPLRIGYSIGQRFSGFVNLGLTPSYLIRARTLYIGGASADDTEKLNRFELSGEIEIGCGYRIRKSYFVYTSIAYSQGFTSISNENYFDGSNIKNYGIIASLGLKYRLPRR